MTTVATALACAASTTRAANLVTYPFSNNLDAQVSAAADGVTASGFLGNGGSQAVVGMGSNDGAYAYILITKTSTNAGNSVSNNQFAQFTVTPPPSSGMQLAQIQVSAARGGDSTPRGLALRWSFDGYKANLGVVNINSNWPGTRTYVFHVNAFAGGPVTFRLYAFAKEISKAEPSIRMDNLVVTGSPIIYAPTVTPKSTFIETTKSSATLRGTAYSSEGIGRVEVSKAKPNGVYSGANGTTSWKYKATNLRYRTTSFYVRAIDETGEVGPAVKVRIKRVKPAP